MTRESQTPATRSPSSAYIGSDEALIKTGLHLLANYVSVDAERQLLSEIYSQRWLVSLRRRVQHYGYAYDYRARRVSADMALGPLPSLLETLARRLHADGIMARVPEQVIVNEYLPGQGIAAHIDCEPCFGDTIASLSLGSACVMDFAHRDGDGAASLLLESRSLLILAGPARSVWTHGIAARKTDRIGGRLLRRERRVSVTFRTILLQI